MKLGFVDSCIGKMLVYGACGTGKSTFIDLLMENPAKEVRISTPLAARPMSMFQFDLTNEQHWANLNPEQRKEFLAKITAHIEAELEEESGSEEEGTSGKAVTKNVPTYIILLIVNPLLFPSHVFMSSRLGKCLLTM